MAIVLPRREAGSPPQQNSLRFAADLGRGGGVCLCRLAFYELLTDPEAERGLARLVQSWFFCFLLARPSPFQSCADVKGCEVTTRGRYWVGEEGEAGPAEPGQVVRAQSFCYICVA